MKKKDILSLIKHHCDNEDQQFREVAYNIARDFDRMGDIQLSEYILGCISQENTISIQSMENEPVYFSRVQAAPKPPILPDPILADTEGIHNALHRGADVSKFLLYGPPGTGKTEYVKYLANALDRELYFVEFDAVINSKLGETTRNIKNLFDEIRSIRNPDRAIFLFDEIDALALDRVNSSDLREMGRATSAFIKEMDRTSSSYLIFATTNLYDYLDKAITRRFDSSVDFGRYSQSDLVDLSEKMLDEMLHKYEFIEKDMRLFRKIIRMATTLPFPGELKSLLKTSIVFSSDADGYDYLKRLYKALNNIAEIDPVVLVQNGFTLRESERLTGISKSSLSRLARKD